MKQEDLGWAKAKQFCNRAMKYALPVVEAGLEFREKPGVLSGIKFLLKVKGIKDAQPSLETTLFDTPEWSEISSYAISLYLYNQLIKGGAVKIEAPLRNHFWLEFGDVIFGCRATLPADDEGKVLAPDLFMPMSEGKFNPEALEIIRNLFWGAVGSSAALIVNEDGNYEIHEHEHVQNFDTLITQKYSAEIAAFKSGGFSRSFLFYGPPGTGKSSSAAQILHSLKYRTLILNNAKNLSISWLKEYVEFLGAEAVLVEDLDHLGSTQLNLMLDGFQYLTSKGILILSTCNKIANMDDALIRNGRFDECIEINTLPIEVIAGFISDEDVLQEVKNYPIAAIMEVKRRLEVLGKEETLKRMGDLNLRVERNKSAAYKL